jgi:hypothetical protein
MKTYNNGPRKRMMYGGAAKNKPMMYGGMAAKKKPRKKAYGGGMMTTTQPQQNMMQSQMMQQPKMMMGMKKGGKTFPDLNKDGKITQADILKGRGVFNKGGRAYGKNEMGMINARLGHAVESLISNTDSDNPDGKLKKSDIKMYVNDIKLAVETGIAEADDPKIKQALRRATK